MMIEKYIFVGNRRFVLEQMQSLGLKIVKVLVVKGSYLEKDLQNGLLPDLKNIEFIVNKSELLEFIRTTDFDILVSNGCPYILPIDDLPNAKYINIHPSCLPDLRGVDPVIGAVLFDREAGASCHIMDQGIDTGQIVAQVKIPMTDDLDVTLIYHISFLAERRVFADSFSRNFKHAFTQVEKSDLVLHSQTRRSTNHIS